MRAGKKLVSLPSVSTMISVKTRTFSSPSHARYLSVWLPLAQKSHYDTLGLLRSASQADIKSAFYKLSKKHHPDANVNDPTATAKFQELVEAYEVLGSEGSRKRYDVGMTPAYGSTSVKPGFKTPDDPKAAFYKSRIANKMNKPMAAKVYDFDQWTKAHYTDTMHENIRMNKYSARRSTIRQTSSQSYSQQPNFDQYLSYLLGVVIVVGIAVVSLRDPDHVSKSK